MPSCTRPFTRTGAPIMVMDCASAELRKYAANAMLATRISFMNEMANVCELVGADVDQVRKAIGSDQRIGTSFLFPGVGYGGSCFPEGRAGDDPLRRATRTTTSGSSSAVEAVNEARRRGWSTKMRTHFGDLKGKTIAVWGLAFKPRTDDMREAPAIPLIEALLGAGAEGAGLRPGGGEGRARHLRRPHRSLCAEQLRRAEGRRRAGDRHRVERVPAARFRRMQHAHASAGRLRRPQPLHTRADEAARASPTTPLAATEPSTVLVTGWRRLHRQPRRQGAAPGRSPGRHLRQPVGGPSRGGPGRAARRRRHRATSRRCGAQSATAARRR